MLLILLLSLLAHNPVLSEPIPWLEIAYNASSTSITLQLLKNTTSYLTGPDYLHSWCGNFRYSTQNIHYPQSVGEVQQIVKNATKVRVLGQRHSSSRIADSNDTIISTLALKQVLAFDPVVPSVIVQGGITYTDLAPFLQYLGYGLPNLASINVRSDSNSTVRSMETLFGATKAKGQVSPVPLFLSPTFMADQGKEQPWHYGLVDYHLGLSGTDGTEIETEYFLPYENAVPALKALAALSPTFSPLLLYFLVRTAKADDLWMSGSYGEDTVIINLTFLPFMPGVAVVLPLIEQTLFPFGCRPHWGKVFLMGPEQYLQHYPKIQEFRALVQEIDPTHKFRNPFLDYNVFSDNTTGTTVNNILTGIIDGTLYNVGTGAVLNNIAGAIGLVSGNIYGSLFGK